MLKSWTYPSHWFKKRDEYMRAARDCRDILHRTLSAEDPRVRDAVNIWVSKARRFHAIAMNREPIIRNCIFISGSDVASGALYAKEDTEKKDGE